MVNQYFVNRFTIRRKIVGTAKENQNRGSIERKPGLVFYTKYFTLPFPNGGELDGRGYKEGAEHR